MHVFQFWAFIIFSFSYIHLVKSWFRIERPLFIRCIIRLVISIPLTVLSPPNHHHWSTKVMDSPSIHFSIRGHIAFINITIIKNDTYHSIWLILFIDLTSDSPDLLFFFVRIFKGLIFVFELVKVCRIWLLWWLKVSILHQM